MNALALVVGNANYDNSKNRLINAVNDANDFGAKLRTLGFVVKILTDCTTETFDREVQGFSEDLKKFEVGLFFFSGHGLQINGKNYLTSVDTSFVDSLSLKHTSLPLDEVIDYMEQAGPKVKILILDACRNNPLPNMYRSVSNNSLASIHAPQGTIIAFSTSPGETAQDYGAGRNSIYTGSLLNHIDDKNIPVEEFFKRVRTSVFTLSKRKQTSWEHTSLIGNFYFNSGDLVHSIELPYKKEYIADENFQSNGTNIDLIIEDLKSHNFYTQKPAIERLRTTSLETVDVNSLFLLGRNILQTAVGGEFSAQEIFRKLDSWLLKYFTDEENHVLNGILYEIYFNSKGRFRQSNFKNDFINEIFHLQTNRKYKSCFDFIIKQLSPFHEFLYYIPTNQPIAFAIEIQFEKFEYSKRDEKRVGYRLISIKHEEVELLVPYEDTEFNATSVNYNQFLSMLYKELSVPISMLRLSMNFETDEIKTVNIPWPLKISRKKNE